MPVNRYLIAIYISLQSLGSLAQTAESGRNLPPPEKPVEKFNLLLYTRVISDASGNVRIDENVVSNFKLNRWMRLELGLRFGERPHHFNSYYHYKAELQSRTLFKTVRLLARISDNVIRYPLPVYRKTNLIFVAEARRKLSPRFSGLLAGGYVISHQENQSIEALPITSAGVRNNYGVWKASLRYLCTEKLFVEGSWGSYDVFNPYIPTAPFSQLTSEMELSRRVELYGYYRYQYSKSFDVPLNNFYTVGVRVHFY